MQTEIIIRDAQLEDAVALEDILRTIGWFEDINKDTVPQSHAQVMQLLAQCLREGTHTVLVAEQRHVGVVGYLSVHWFPSLTRGIDGYVSELFVHPSGAGKGVGGYLLETIRERAVKRGCTRLILMNRRDRESYQRSFYAKHGWEEQREGAFFTLTLPERKSA